MDRMSAAYAELISKTGKLLDKAHNARHACNTCMKAGSYPAPGCHHARTEAASQQLLHNDLSCRNAQS